MQIVEWRSANAVTRVLFWGDSITITTWKNRLSWPFAVLLLCVRITYAVYLLCICLIRCGNVTALLWFCKLCPCSRYCRNGFSVHSQCFCCTVARIAWQLHSDKTTMGFWCDHTLWLNHRLLQITVIKYYCWICFVAVLSLCFRKSGVTGPLRKLCIFSPLHAPHSFTCGSWLLPWARFRIPPKLICFGTPIAIIYHWLRKWPESMRTRIYEAIWNH